MGVITIDGKPLEVGDDDGSRIYILVAKKARTFHRNHGESDAEMSRRVQGKVDQFRVRPARSRAHHHLCATS